MNKVIILLLFGLVGFAANGQQRFPSGFPTQLNTGWNRWGYAMSDSGLIVANRDTTWFPKFSGTVVFRPTNKQFYWFDSTNLRWNLFGTNIDTTSLSNRINLKLNISDTTGKWLSQSTRLVDTMYRVNDSTVGYTIKGNAYMFQILGRSQGAAGSGLTSVGLSMPSAFSVSGSPLTSNGTISVSGAGAPSQYIRGNGTLGTTDTGMIPNFHLKVRSLLTGSSPITFNQTTGVIGINNATASGTKGAASFTSAFSDNGSGLIDLADLVPTGSCTNCNITYNAKGQATAYSSGTGPTGVAVDTIFRAEGIDSIYFTINGTQYAIKDSAGSGSGAITSVSGTTNRITVTNPTTTPVIDIAATYVGQGSITTLGTITTGVWNGTAVGAVYGGTGQTSVTTGDLLYGSASNTWSKLAGVATGNALISGGIGVAPSWGKIGLTTHVSGILPIANGGTGTSSPGLVAGTGISITGSWPNQTITNTGGSGGAPSLTYKYVGFGGVGNVLSPGQAGFEYDSVIHELTVDSTSAIQHRATYVTLNPISKVDSADGFGDSFMNREVTTDDDSSFLNKTAAFFEVQAKEHAVSGSGIYYATALELRTMVPMHNGVTLFMSGFNTIRNNNILGGPLSGRKTQNAIINGFKSAFASHFLKSYIGASDASITRYGSWTTNLNVYNVGGKTTTAAYTSTQNDSLTFVFTDSTVIVGLIGQNNLNQAGSTYTIYIDGSPVRSATTSDQADGVEDGFGTNGNYIAVAEIVTGLTYASHKVKVVNTGTGVFIADYIGHLRPVSTAPPIVMYNIPYMKGLGYAIAPANSNPARTDTMNVRLDSLYAALPDSYKSKAFMVQTNNFYDTTTGCYTDNVHPNDIGHGQIYEGTAASLNSDQYPEGTFYYGAGYPYFRDATGNYKIILGEAETNHLFRSDGPNKAITSIIQDDGTNIGVGQTPATYKLSVTGSLRNTTDAAFATSSGNVGIGTTTPGFKLEVIGNAGAQGAFVSQGASSGYIWDSRTGGSSKGWAFSSNDNVSTALYSVENTRDMVKFWTAGGFTILDAHEVTPVYAGRTLDVHGAVAIEKDSVQTINSITSQYVLVIDTAATAADSNKVKRILASNLGGGVGISTLNTLTASTQTFATGTSGTDFNISSSTSTHTFNVPSASTSNRGLVTTLSQSFAGIKTFTDAVAITDVTSKGKLTISGNMSQASSPGISGLGLVLSSFTYTDGAGAGTDANGQYFHKINIPTLDATNARTYSGNTATLFMAGSPLASGSATVAHPFNLFAQDVSRIDVISFKPIEANSDITISGSATENGSFLVLTGSGGNTWTLPALATHPGKAYFIKNASSGNLTIQRGGADNIYDTSSVTSISIAAGTARIIFAGSSFWYVH